MLGQGDTLLDGLQALADGPFTQPLGSFVIFTLTPGEGSDLGLYPDGLPLTVRYVIELNDATLVPEPDASYLSLSAFGASAILRWTRRRRHDVTSQ